MGSSTDCTHNTDHLILLHEGTSQDERPSAALDPTYAPVDEHAVAHRIVFARAYSAYLHYFDLNNIPAGDWKPFFGNDISALLSLAAVQDVDEYRTRVKKQFDFLKEVTDPSKEQESKDTLGSLFSSIGMLARQFDILKEGLPVEVPLKAMLQNLIQSQLAKSLKRLLLYYRDAFIRDPLPAPETPYVNDTVPSFGIMGAAPRTFGEIKSQDFSEDWISEDDAARWTDYVTHLDDPSIYPLTNMYGNGDTVLERINHIATHTLFTSIFEQFLKAYARVVNEADGALKRTFTEWDTHEPHYALFLAFLHLFEYARDEMNTLTGRHLDFYYREILRLREKAAEPARAHLLVALAKQARSHMLEAGELFKAGKDDLGRDAFFANDRDFAANHAKVVAKKTVYRHGNEKVGLPTPTEINKGRIYASQVADSDDGLGAELTSADGSWHPFYNKTYENGVLSKIHMPQAEVGFAVASHYLMMAGGTRTVTVKFTARSVFVLSTSLHKERGPQREKDRASQIPPPSHKDHREDIFCRLTGEKGWVEARVLKFDIESMELVMRLSGADPAIIPYSSKMHGYDFATNLPVLLVTLRHRDESPYAYGQFENAAIKQIDLTVVVKRLKTVAVSNDFGPVDTSKPFQPFGAQPVENNALVIGSKEAFRKKLASASVEVTWLADPAPYPDLLRQPVAVNIDFLKEGRWIPSEIAPISVYSKLFPLTKNLDYTVVDVPDFTETGYYDTAARDGFVRLKLNNHFGRDRYEEALIEYIKAAPNNGGAKPVPPIGPLITGLSLNYATAKQTIDLTSTDEAKFEKRPSRFFHITPFGHAEQHPYLKTGAPDKAIFLLPQMRHLNERDDKLPKGQPVVHEAEFYIGVTNLQPPQNLALLFQVADGTADPLSEKPKPHIDWSYLCGNEWFPFRKNDIEDKTRELLTSGIVTFAVPRDATDANSLLPAGMHWIRGAVESKSDSVCRLRMVAAQALEATFTDKGNDPAFPSKVLKAGTISKLDRPDAAVKSITQPFETFGGRGKEAASAFYTRISERLRHKDRAVALWDCERLVLEAFPEIYKAKCLNHVQYEPTESGTGTYRELAPGHVTIVTIPRREFHNLRDPLRPYTSLGLLKDIEAFLLRRLSCFVKLHVNNPVFEEVRVDFKVRLHDGFDETFYSNKLRESLTRFLSPWAFAGGGSPTFGGKVYKSLLINFVEDQPCVDYVTDFQLFHSFKDNDGTDRTVRKDEVEGSKAVSILVSSRQHTIDTIKVAASATSGEKCGCDT